MPYLPLFHNLEDKSCVVVGGGTVAARKIRLLHEAGAHVAVYARDILPSLQDNVMAAGGQCYLVELSETSLLENTLFHEAIAEAALVIAALDDPDCNAIVAALAHLHHVPVNVVDDPELSSCIFPSSLQRGPLTIAVSSGGTAPVLTRLLRAKLESWLPSSLATLAEQAATLRDPVREQLPDPALRRRFWDQLLQESLLGPSATTTLADPMADAEAILNRAAHFQHQSESRSGRVDTVVLDSLDPDQLRFCHLRWLQGADLIIHTEQVPISILSLSRRDAERECLPVGEHAARAINACTEGHQVVTIHLAQEAHHESV